MGAEGNQGQYGTHTLVVTMNNTCNLECTHCYLQYDHPESGLISDELIRDINSSSVRHVVIGGKEPFVSGKSSKITSKMIEGAHASNKRVSVITNGTRLEKFLAEDFPKPDFMDISFDGGPKSYGITRGDHYDQSFKGAERVLELGIPLHILHTIHSGNVEFLDDMMTPQLDLESEGLKMAIFSPYIVTNNDGVNKAGYLPVEDMIKELSRTRKFMEFDKSFILLDPFTVPGMEDQFEKLSKNYGMKGKMKMVSREQIARIMRVTYNGIVLTPQQSPHPSVYDTVGFRYDSKVESLDETLERCRKGNLEEIDLLDRHNVDLPNYLLSQR